MNSYADEFFGAPPKNLIVRMPNWLGDCVMATPVIEDLRKAFPHAQITAMCQGSVGDMLIHDPHLDTIFRFKKPSGWIHLKNERISPIKKGEYDVGVLLTNSFSSAWWFWRGGVERRIGFAGDKRSFLLTDAVSRPDVEEHLVSTYKRLLEPLQIPLSKTVPKLYVSKEEVIAARALMSKHSPRSDQKVIGVNPGAAFGSAKCWPLERFRKLTEKILVETPYTLMYFGDPSLTPLVNEICLGFGERVVNLAGRTSLRELLALIQQCDAFLSNDSGPMHMAAALKTPLVAIFGSTSDVKTGPYQWGTVIHKHVACSPCYRRVCPIDFRCMTRIAVDEVFDALIQALKNKGE